MSTATLTSKGQITIPAQVRNRLGISPGDKIEFVALGDREFAIVPATRSIKELRGIFRGRRQKPVSVEEMNEAIARKAAEWK
jgi:AbrB family looped-hinge helix DNA binding protein